MSQWQALDPLGRLARLVGWIEQRAAITDVAAGETAVDADTWEVSTLMLGTAVAAPATRGVACRKIGALRRLRVSVNLAVNEGIGVISHLAAPLDDLSEASPSSMRWPLTHLARTGSLRCISALTSLAPHNAHELLDAPMYRGTV